MAYVSVATRPTTDTVIWLEDLTISTDGTDMVYNTAALGPGWGSDAESRVFVILELIVMYLSATDTNNTNNIRLGTASVESKFLDFSTPSGKSEGDVDVIDHSAFSQDRVFVTDNTVRVVRAGGVGTGAVRVGVRISFDITKSTAYSPIP